jgi:hypothetical protein
MLLMRRAVLLMGIVVLLAWGSSLVLLAAPAEKITTSIQIDNSSPKIRLTVRSSASFTWHLERLRAPSTALGLFITPVEPDPQAPKDIPINSGLIKNIKIVQREKSLLIAIEVVSFPHFSIQESGNHREMTMIVDKEVLEESKGSSKKKQPGAMIPNSQDKKSLLHAFHVLFDAAGSPSLKAPSPPLQVKSEPDKAPAPPSQSIRKNLSLIMKASPAGKRPLEQSPRAQKGSSRGEMLHREFVKTDLVVILKFLASHMGLDLVASSYVKGIKSIEISDMTAEEALPLVLRGTGYAHRISEKILLVGPADIIDTLTPRMSTEPKEGQTQLFVLKKIRIEMILLRLMKEFPDAHIEAHRNLNALTITASTAILKKIELFLLKADAEGAPPRKTDPQP